MSAEDAEMKVDTPAEGEVAAPAAEAPAEITHMEALKRVLRHVSTHAACVLVRGQSLVQ